LELRGKKGGERKGPGKRRHVIFPKKKIGSRYGARGGKGVMKIKREEGRGTAASKKKRKRFSSSFLRGLNKRRKKGEKKGEN